MALCSELGGYQHGTQGMTQLYTEVLTPYLKENEVSAALNISRDSIIESLRLRELRTTTAALAVTRPESCVRHRQYDLKK